MGPVLTFNHLVREVCLPVRGAYFTLGKRLAEVHGDHLGEADDFPIVDRAKVVIGLGGKGTEFHESLGSNSEISKELLAVV